MKAIILAAGEGTRLKKYTKDLPKGMLPFAGATLIERQLGLLRDAGIKDISVVTGFKGGHIDYKGVTYFENPAYASTNMPVSLFCAEEKLEGDVVVLYSDIVYERSVLERLLSGSHDVAVAVDTEWRRYWRMRYGTEERDTESLRLKGDRIVSLGREGEPPGDIEARYVGLLKFSSKGIEWLKAVWEKYKGPFWDRPWQVSGRPLRQAYMTDVVQALIDEGHEVHAVKSRNGWLEFDTVEDYEHALGWLSDGTIRELIRLDE